MIKQNKNKLPFILAAGLMLTVAACNNGEKKETTTDSVVTKTVTPVLRDSNDTMEKKTGKVAPGSDIKPQ